MIKVSANSKPAAVAAAIAGELRSHHHVTLQVIGAAAVNQAIKALVLARGNLAPYGLDLTIQPELVKVADQSSLEEKTAIRLTAYVFQRPQ